MSLVLNLDRLRDISPVLVEELKKIQDYLNLNVTVASGDKQQPQPASVAEQPTAQPAAVTTPVTKQSPPPPTITNDPRGAGGLPGRPLK